MARHRHRPTDVRGEHAVDTEVLLAVDAASGPLGARDVNRALHGKGYKVSEATVSRRLRELDETGLTRPVDRKGRVLTERGSAELASRLRGAEHSDLLGRVAEVDTAEDVLNLLLARRLIEPEAVRAGVGRFDEKSLAILAESIDEHAGRLAGNGRIPRRVALDFHRTVTGCSGNPLIHAMTRIALDPSMDHAEAMLDVILQEHNVGGDSVVEHRQILRAITAGDADAAESAMRSHLDRLIAQTRDHVESDGGARG